MTVYIELSLAENFCMDFCLLFAAKAASKNTAGYFRLAAASALGACFAVVFPTFCVDGVLSVIIKIAAGAAMCAVAGKFTKFSGYIRFLLIFFALAFLLGGALLGVFSLADINYVQGGGFFISSVPVGIPLFCVLTLALAVRAAAKRFGKPPSKNSVICRIFVGQSQVSVPAFYDSGNRVFYSGSPVSVVPQNIANKLLDVARIKTFTEIHTVAGSRKMAVFTADKIEIDDGKQIKTIKGVKLGVSPNKISRAVLHPDLAEAN